MVGGEGRLSCQIEPQREAGAGGGSAENSFSPGAGAQQRELMKMQPGSSPLPEVPVEGILSFRSG